LGAAPGSVEHQFADCRTKYRAHVAVCFERAVARTVHYTILSASETSMTVVKSGSGCDAALENGRTLFVVSLCLSTNLWTCLDGCGKKTYKGRPCVHILKILQSKGLPFFDERYFHSHWRVTSAVTSKDIQRWYKEHDTSSDCVPSDDDNNDDYNRQQDDSDNDLQQPRVVSNAIGDNSLVLRSGSDPTKVNGMSNRFAYAKKLFDNIAKVPYSLQVNIYLMYFILYSVIFVCFGIKVFRSTRRVYSCRGYFTSDRGTC
jgi:hypothetical protein